MKWKYQNLIVVIISVVPLMLNGYMFDLVPCVRQNLLPFEKWEGSIAYYTYPNHMLQFSRENKKFELSNWEKLQTIFSANS
jgi:hypothetical protein